MFKRFNNHKTFLESKKKLLNFLKRFLFQIITKEIFDFEILKKKKNAKYQYHMIYCFIL